jgi:hypothetical protein
MFLFTVGSQLDLVNSVLVHLISRTPDLRPPPPERRVLRHCTRDPGLGTTVGIKCLCLSPQVLLRGEHPIQALRAPMRQVSARQADHATLAGQGQCTHGVNGGKVGVPILGHGARILVAFVVVGVECIPGKEPRLVIICDVRIHHGAGPCATTPLLCNPRAVFGQRLSRRHVELPKEPVAAVTLRCGFRQ